MSFTNEKIFKWWINLVIDHYLHDLLSIPWNDLTFASLTGSPAHSRSVSLPLISEGELDLCLCVRDSKNISNYIPLSSESPRFSSKYDLIALILNFIFKEMRKYHRDQNNQAKLLVLVKLIEFKQKFKIDSRSLRKFWKFLLFIRVLIKWSIVEEVSQRTS